MNYKKRIYEKYVSAHNARLYGEIDEGYVRKHFSAFASYYGNVLPGEKNANILDVGCGDGALVLWLQESGFENASGIDVSEEQVNVAKELGIKNVEQGDAARFLENKESSFDLIFARDMLGHLDGKEEVMELLALAHKALKKGGKMIIKTPNAESPMSGRLRYGDFTHDISFTGQSLRQILLVSGFKKVRVFATPPVVHGAKSAIRYVLWKIIEAGLKCYRLVEAGSGEGIFTQNVIVIGEK